jgi:hypothetical protein
MMGRKLRKIPLVCFSLSLVRLLIGNLKYSKHYLGNSVKMEDGREFVIFRHITTYPLIQSTTDCVFIVSFKFARLSHKANKIVSIIPMLLITGFPGFISKCYAVNHNSGYWQGMYQWKSMKHLEEYKKSLVYKMMNKRAITETIKSIELNKQKLTDFIEDNTVSD